MAQVDASIPLGVQPFKMPDPIEKAGKVYALKEMADENKQREEQRQSQRKMQDIFRSGDMSTPEGQQDMVRQVGTVNPQAAMVLSNQFSQQAKAKIDMQHALAATDHEQLKSQGARLELAAQTQEPVIKRYNELRKTMSEEEAIAAVQPLARQQKQLYAATTQMDPQKQQQFVSQPWDPKQAIPTFESTNRGIQSIKDEQALREKKIADERLERQEKETERHHRALEKQGQQRIDVRDASSQPGLPPGFAQDDIDYYAKQTLAGDNSWRTGLGRTAGGAQIIRAVDARVPALARQSGITPEEASTQKETRKGLEVALKDRTKFVATGEQFVNNFQRQADLVEKYMKAGAAGQSPIINRWIQKGRKSVEGDPDVAAFDTAIRGLAREHQRIVTGVTSNAQLHASAQATADELLNKDMSPGQIKSTLKVMREEANNALSSGREEVKGLQKKLSEIGTAKPKEEKSQTKAPQAALDHLKSHPELKEQFKQKYGYLPE